MHIVYNSRRRVAWTSTQCGALHRGSRRPARRDDVNIRCGRPGGAETHPPHRRASPGLIEQRRSAVAPRGALSSTKPRWWPWRAVASARARMSTSANRSSLRDSPSWRTWYAPASGQQHARRHANRDGHARREQSRAILRRRYAAGSRRLNRKVSTHSSWSRRVPASRGAAGAIATSSTSTSRQLATNWRQRGDAGATADHRAVRSAGSGKSTLAAALAALLGARGLTVAALSLDDFYLTHAERQSLARTMHPAARNALYPARTTSGSRGNPRATRASRRSGPALVRQGDRRPARERAVVTSPGPPTWCCSKLVRGRAAADARGARRTDQRAGAW